MVPFDQASPFITSGIRIGTPALTTRGMDNDAMREIAGMIDRVIKNPKNEAVLSAVQKEINDLCSRFPLYNVK